MPATLELLPAVQADYPTLAAIGREAFRADALAYGKGPDIYENPAFLLPLLRDEPGCVRKLAAGGQIIGLIVTYARTAASRWLGCICLLPSWQGLGYGLEAVRLLEAAYPDVRQWGLDTPAASEKNRRFYQKAGYRAVDESEPWPGFRLTVYEKRL